MKTVSRFVISALVPALVAAFALEAMSQGREKANFPHTDIFLFDIQIDGAQSELGAAKNITARPGYDNQPFFTPRGDTILYARGDEYQTDVYEYLIDSGEIRQITDSPGKEFSPTPNADNTAIAFVSDRDGGVWIADRSAIDQPRPLLQNSENPEATGYFAWNHKTDEVFYWSRYGFSVILSNLKTGSRYFVTGHTPPATPRVIPGTDSFSFVHRQANEEVWIKAFDPATAAIRPLLMIPGSNHNYVWTPDASLLTIQNDVLYFARATMESEWMPIADLAKQGVSKANRLALSPDGKRLAIVGVGVGVGSSVRAIK